MEELKDIDIHFLLDKIEPLIKTMEYVKMDITLSPSRDHIITSIKYQNLLQLRTDFVRRLTSSTIKYVLSKTKYEAEKDQLQKDGFDESDIAAEMFQHVARHFRKSDIKGQFSELLLFNLLQYHFHVYIL